MVCVFVWFSKQHVDCVVWSYLTKAGSLSFFLKNLKESVGLMSPRTWFKPPVAKYCDTNSFKGVNH